MIIHSGLLPEMRKASTTSRRLTMRAFFWPEASLSSARSWGGELLQVDVGEQLLHRLGAHARLKVVLVLLPHVPVFLLREDLVLGQGGEAGVGDNIAGEVEHLLQNPGADVQQQAHPGGMPLKYQMWLTGAASSMWPMRSRRTLAR